MEKFLITSILFVLSFCVKASSLEPNEILVIVNSDIDASKKLGDYYCSRRNIPQENILGLHLGAGLTDLITRENYDSNIAEPVRKFLSQPDSPNIKCILTTYGVPFKVGPRILTEQQQENLKKLDTSVKDHERELKNSPQDKHPQIKKEINTLKKEISSITASQTDAALDSELSVVLSGPYELHGYLLNQLNRHFNYPKELITTIMVSRLDGPSLEIAEGLVDKALTAEKNGLHGNAYIDSRGMADDKKLSSYGSFDQKMRSLAVLLRFRTKFEVKEERTEKLFGAQSCPNTAIYCGWYSLRKYVDSFDFVDGAIGIHVASLEAVDIRDSNSTQWCPSLLVHGVTATYGPVAEPYLNAFPDPQEFFLELIEGKCLAEAFYRTLPFCSWQIMLIGDPLYTPFAKKDS